MEPQTPAEGILKRSDWGDSKFYHVACTCGSDDDTIEFEVEADDHGVTVTTWTTQKTEWWDDKFKPSISTPYVEEVEEFWCSFWSGLYRRVQLTWNIWVHGYVKYQSTTIMTEQQAINYAETLKSAAKDCRDFHNQRMAK